MVRHDLLEKIKRIELKLLSKSSNLNQGDYKTSFKGQGMIFSEVRNYQYGDDVRNIDWNVTARFKETFVKVFEQEKDKNIILLIDVSSSGLIGYEGRFKNESILEVAATVMLSAQKQNLPVGALVFTDKAEFYFPPKKGKAHILQIINSLIEFKKHNQKTSLVEPLKWFRSKKIKKSTLILISDFKLRQDYFNELKTMKSKHELWALKIENEKEVSIPNMGWIEIFDPETGSKYWINSSNRKAMDVYTNDIQIMDNELKIFCRNNNIRLHKIYINREVFEQINKVFIR